MLGPYRLVSQLGRGGFAPVWLAREMYGEKEFRTVAVKLFCVEPLAGGSASSGLAGREQIVEEARALCQVEHPNIVRFYNFQTDATGDVLGIVMEYARGASLDKQLLADGKLSVADTLALGVAIASALAEVHKVGLVHRDVKPGNVIDANGVYKLIDFGIAAGDRASHSRREAATGIGAVRSTPRIILTELPRDVKGTRLTALADTLHARGDGAFGDAEVSEIPSGTLGYIDPDCIARLSPAGRSSDLYSLGAMLYECLTGTVPAAAAAIVSGSGGLRPEVVDGREAPPPLLDVAPEAPERLGRLIDALLSPDPDGRTSSAADVRDELERIRVEVAARASLEAQGGSPGAPTRAANATDSSRSAHVGRTRARLGVAFAGSAVVAAFVAIWFASRASPPPSEPFDAGSSLSLAAAGDAGAPLEPALPAVVPLEESPWSLAIAEGQKLLTAGDVPGATGKFKASVDLDGGVVARAFVDQVGAAFAAPAGPCTLVAFSHPRLGYASRTSRPSIAPVPGGAVVVWGDDHEQPSQEHAYSVMIDATGHPTSKERDLTPEGASIFRPALTAVDDRAVLLYWDGKGQDPGVHVRWLRSDGRIAGPGILVDPGRPANLWPALTKTPDGYVVAWQDDRAGGGGDEVYLRKLGRTLEPVGPESRATTVGVDAGAYTPSIALADDNVLVAYTLDRGPHLRVLKLRRFPLGPPDASIDTAQRESSPVTIVGEDRVVPDAPDVACGKDGCFLVWNGTPSGAFAAQIDVEKRSLIWHKKFSPNGGRPALAVNAAGDMMVAFFEAGLVKLASLSGDGVGDESVVGRTSGDPPHAWIAAGRGPSEWLVAWQGQEGGHDEPYAARMVCGK